MLFKKLSLIPLILYFTFLPSRVFGFDKGLLWQIEAPNGAISQLFGTMHLIDEDMNAVFEMISDDVKQSRITFIEYTLDETNNAFILNNLIKTKTPMKDRLSAKELFKLKQFMQKNNLPFEALQSASPFLIHSYLMNPGSMHSMQIDFKIGDLALKQGIPLKGLEKAEAVFNRMLAFDNSFYISAIKNLIRNIDVLPTHIKKIKAFYFKEDLNSILSSINEKGVDKKLNKAHVSSLVNERNISMFNSAHAELDKGKVFIAVGAAHLGGEKGLLNLLKNAGYKMTRLEVGLFQDGAHGTNGQNGQNGTNGGHGGKGGNSDYGNAGNGGNGGDVD